MENNHFEWVNQLEMAIFNSKLLVITRGYFGSSLKAQAAVPLTLESVEVQPYQTMAKIHHYKIIFLH